MKTVKKALSILMAVAMLVNVFAVLSFAITPDTAIDLTISTDKASYQAGEVVTFTISVETIPEITELGFNGNYPIGYNSKVIGPIGAVDDLAAYNIVDLAGGYDDTISGVFPIDAAEIDEKATSKGWDSALMLSLADDATLFPVTEKVPLLSFQMKLADDVADGDYIVGFNDKSFETYNAYVNGYYGITGAESGVPTTNTFGCGYTTVHVGAAVAEPTILTYGGAQIRFDDVDASGTYADHKDGSFDVRTIAKIAKADFDATFGGEEAAMNKDTGITDFGFVYAAKSNVPDFNIDTAKEVAMGGSAANYEKKSLTYMQRAADGYLFTCVIENIKDADVTDGVNCLAYVKYGAEGKYIFFNAVGTADYTDLHTHVPGYTA